MAASDGRLSVGLVQINNSFTGQNYLPYSAGILQAFAQRHLAHSARYEFRLPLYRRLPVAEAVARLSGSDVVFFSTYVWNIRLSLAIARALKAQEPRTLVVFGGPQVPDRAETFLRAHPFIDMAVHGEGERVFSMILERGATPDWTGIPGISFLRPDGTFVTRAKGPRLGDLSLVPSPYLDGLFDPLMAANPDEQWLVLWETNRGCPFSCTFCDWGSAVQSKVFQFDLERLYLEIDWFARHQIEFVFCCDANFGILKRDLDIVEYAVATKERHGFPRALSVQNTKNATERAYQVQKTLADAGLNKGVTISLQSLDPGTLTSIKRANISSASFQELQRRFTRDRVETYTDVILGLPGETYESFADGVDTVIANGQHNRIQFNNLSILPNAEMGAPEYQQKYGLRIVETKIVNIHGALDENEGDVAETQQLVVATDAMPATDWRRTRAFAWTAGLLHFDKVLQIPLVVLHETGGVHYRELIEAFSEGALHDFPVLAEMQQFFLDKARDIQDGGSEYCRSDAWLGIWWPADEYVLISLSVEGKLDRFYDEAARILGGFLRRRGVEVPPDLLGEAVQLNRALLKQPFQVDDLELPLAYNVWELYQAALLGEPITVQRAPRVHRIDRTSARWSSWDAWCREVIWYGNKKGAYLYGQTAVEPRIAGHF
jgi:radical SAM superfamily enzyme YgiQ (UPF0313 family)